MTVAIQLAKFLIKNRQRASPRRQHRRFHAGDCIGQDPDRIFVTPLRLVQHRLVVHYFQTARSVLACFQQILFRVIELVQLAINLRSAEIDIGVIRHQICKLLIDDQRFRILFLGHQRLAETPQVAELRWIEIGRALVGLFRFGEFSCLRVGIAEKVEQHGRRRVAGHSFEQGHRLGRFSFVEQELRQLLDRRLVVRVGFQDGAQNFLGFVVLVSQAVQAREPEGGLCVGRIEAIDFLVLLDGTRGDLGLAAVLAQVAQAAEVNSREQAASRHIIGIALENILRFSNRVAQALRLPVHLRQTLTNHRRLGIQRIGLLIKFDGLRRVFRLAGVFVLLLVDVPHGEVVVGVGTVGRRGCRAARQRDTRSGRGGWQLTLWRGRRGSFRLSLCRLLRPGIGPSQRAKEGCGNGQSTKVHKYPETKSIPCGSGTVKRQNCGISLLWKCLPIGCGNGDKR